MFERIARYLISFMLGMLLVGYPLTHQLEEATDTIVALDTQLGVALFACPETMVCYEPYGAAPAAQYVMDASMVVVHFADKSEMPAGTEAYAQWAVNYDTNISTCIITVQFPTHVLGDPIMDSIGHEFLHCIVGAFHE